MQECYCLYKYMKRMPSIITTATLCLSNSAPPNRYYLMPTYTKYLFFLHAPF